MEILFYILVGVLIGFLWGRYGKRTKQDGILEVSKSDITKIKSLNMDDIEPKELAKRSWVSIKVLHTE